MFSALHTLWPIVLKEEYRSTSRKGQDFLDNLAQRYSLYLGGGFGWYIFSELLILANIAAHTEPHPKF
jgi:hypothetical protein